MAPKAKAKAAAPPPPSGLLTLEVRVRFAGPLAASARVEVEVPDFMSEGGGDGRADADVGPPPVSTTTLELGTLGARAGVADGSGDAPPAGQAVPADAAFVQPLATPAQVDEVFASRLASGRVVVKFLLPEPEGEAGKKDTAFNVGFPRENVSAFATLPLSQLLLGTRETDLNVATTRMTCARLDGLLSLRVKVRAEKPLLDESLQRRLKPLHIKIAHSVNLPAAGSGQAAGVAAVARAVVADAKLQALADKHLPVMATDVVPWQRSVQWQSGVVWLMGLLPPRSANELLQRGSLLIELRDREAPPRDGQEDDGATDGSDRPLARKWAPEHLVRRLPARGVGHVRLADCLLQQGVLQRNVRVPLSPARGTDRERRKFKRAEGLGDLRQLLTPEGFERLARRVEPACGTLPDYLGEGTEVVCRVARATADVDGFCVPGSVLGGRQAAEEFFRWREEGPTTAADTGKDEGEEGKGEEEKLVGRLVTNLAELSSEAARAWDRALHERAMRNRLKSGCPAVQKLTVAVEVAGEGTDQANTANEGSSSSAPGSAGAYRAALVPKHVPAQERRDLSVTGPWRRTPEEAAYDAGLMFARFERVAVEEWLAQGRAAASGANPGPVAEESDVDAEACARALANVKNATADPRLPGGSGFDPIAQRQRDLVATFRGRDDQTASRPPTADKAPDKKGAKAAKGKKEEKNPNEGEHDERRAAERSAAQQDAATESIRQTAIDTRHERFSRLVVILNRHDKKRCTQVSQSILRQVEQANAAALGVDVNSDDVAARLATYEMPAGRRQDPSLDVLSGVCIFDNDKKLFVVEGPRPSPASSARSFANLLGAIERSAPNSVDSSVILSHAHVGFVERLYGGFGAQLKHVRLRVPLARLNTTQVKLVDDVATDGPTHVVFDQLNSILRADRLAQCKLYSLFPSEAHVSHLEELFGGFVSNEDLAGGAPEGGTHDGQSVAGRSRAGGRARSAAEKARTDALNRKLGGLDEGNLPGENEAPSEAVANTEESGGDRDVFGDLDDDTRIVHPDLSRRGAVNADVALIGRRRAAAKASELEDPDWCQNPEYEVLLRARREREDAGADAAARNKAAVRDASERNALSRSHEKPDLSFLQRSGGVAYIYSSQKLNSAELQKDAMRAEMQGWTNSRQWTYAPAYSACGFPDGAAVPAGGAMSMRERKARVRARVEAERNEAAAEEEARRRGTSQSQSGGRGDARSSVGRSEAARSTFGGTRGTRGGTLGGASLQNNRSMRGTSSSAGDAAGQSMQAGLQASASARTLAMHTEYLPEPVKRGDRFPDELIVEQQDLPESQRFRVPRASTVTELRAPLQRLNTPRKEELEEQWVENEWHSFRLGEERARPLNWHTTYECADAAATTASARAGGTVLGAATGAGAASSIAPGVKHKYEQPFDVNRVYVHSKPFGPKTMFESVHPRDHEEWMVPINKAEKAQDKSRRVVDRHYLEVWNKEGSRMGRMTSGQDRCEDILHGDPQLAQLKFSEVRATPAALVQRYGRVRTHRLEPLPVGIRHTETWDEQSDNALFQARLRGNDGAPAYNAATGAHVPRLTSKLQGLPTSGPKYLGTKRAGTNPEGPAPWLHTAEQHAKFGCLNDAERKAWATQFSDDRDFELNRKAPMNLAREDFLWKRGVNTGQSIGGPGVSPRGKGVSTHDH